jgi:photosystem II stability/assembly factor-like uncharacterized protein
VLLGLAVGAGPGGVDSVSAGLNAWTTSGPGVGQVSILAIDPQTPAIVYAGTTGPVFKSTDGGASWARPVPGLPQAGPQALVIDPLVPSTLYAATSGGVFKSTDGAVTWSPASAGLPDAASARDLVIDPRTPATLYVLTEVFGSFPTQKEIFKSTDGGTSWVPADAGLPAASLVGSVAIDPVSPTTLYAPTTVGLFMTTDGGASWTAVNPDAPATTTVRIAVDPVTPTTLYGVTGSGEVLKSTDAGATLVPAGTGLPAEGARLVAIDPSQPATLYAGTANGVFKSTDGAASWGPANTGLTQTVLAVAIDPVTPARVYAGTGDGAFTSPDGGATWTPASAGIIATFVASLVIDPLAPATLYASASAFRFSGTIYKSADGGVTWTALAASAGPLAIDPLTPTTVYAGTFNGGVLKTTDGGMTWAPVNSGSLCDFFGNCGGFISITALAIDPRTPATVYAAEEVGGIQLDFHKTIDGGANWALADTGLPLRERVSVVRVDPVTPAILYAAAGREGVFKSMDGAATWAPASFGLTDLDVRSLAIDPVTPTTLYAGTPSGVFKSTDGGVSWSPAGSGIPPGVVSALVVDPVTPTTVYAGTGAAVSGRPSSGAAGAGVFKSLDGGASWVAINPGLLEPVIETLAIDPVTPARLYAGTAGGGVFQLEQRDVRLTVTRAGTGAGSVASLPAGITCDADCSEPYAFGTVVRLAATATDDSTFAGFGGDADCADGVITMLADVTCTATFIAPQFTVTILRRGSAAGTVTSAPGGIDCGETCAQRYDRGTVVTLTATPSGGAFFGGFGGDPDCADGTITVDADLACTVRFSAPPTPVVPPDGSRFPLDAPTPVTIAWLPLPGAVQYFLEFTGPDRAFTNPNGTAPDGVHGFGGAGGGVLVTGTSITVTLDPAFPLGAYQVRIAGLSAAGALLGTFSDAITVVLGPRLPAGARPALTMPPAGTVVPAGTSVTFIWQGLEGVTRYFFEFTGPNGQFANPNGTTTDPVNGQGGAGGGLPVTGTTLAVTVPPGTPPGTYEARVIGLAVGGQFLGQFSDAVRVTVP